MGFSTLSVVTPASNTNLTTLAQLKADLALGDDSDALYTRIIELCSDDIAAYLGRGVDEAENFSLGVETISETFYDQGCVDTLTLGRRPIVQVTSVTESSATTARQLSNTDGAVTQGDKTFTSAGGPAGAAFSSALIGREITVAGAGEDGAALATTIASVTSVTEVELTDAASTTVSAASYSVANPSFTYVVRKAAGQISKRVGTVRATFLSDPLTVIYSAGWVMPGDAGRTLPKAIEGACILFCQSRIDQFEQDEDFSGALAGVEVDGLAKFNFAGADRINRGNGVPDSVRALLERWVQPTFA